MDKQRVLTIGEIMRRNNDTLHWSIIGHHPINWIHSLKGDSLKSLQNKSSHPRVMSSAFLLKLKWYKALITSVVCKKKYTSSACKDKIIVLLWQILRLRYCCIKQSVALQQESGPKINPNSDIRWCVQNNIELEMMSTC